MLPKKEDNMNSDPKLAKERLQTASHRKDHVKRWGWLLVMSAVSVAVMVVFATMDYWLMLPPHLRYGAWAILAFLAVLGGWGLRRLFRKPTPLKEAALDAEAEQPDLGCIVSTAAEYASGKVSATNEYEPELAAALQSEAAKRLENVELPYRSKLWRPISAFGIAVALIIFFVAVTPRAWTALKRIAFPWMKAQYTEVVVKPGDAEVRVGQDLDISSVFTGRPPRAPKVYWQKGDDPVWQSVALEKSDDGAFVYPLKNVTAPVKYRVTGGDAVSPDFQITPFIPPEVKDFSLGVTYPEYTKLKPVSQTSPEITVLRGSTATIHLRANVELSRALLRLTDTNAAPVELRRGENQVWAGSLQITKDMDYVIELFDQKGRKGEDTKSYHLTAQADAPPKVEILDPAQDMRADATNKIPVRISAADDYGVDEIRLVFHKLNSPEQSILCQVQSEKNGEVIAAGDIDLATLELKRYDVVAFHAEAKDHNTLDGPGIGRSPLYFIEITDKESSRNPPLQGQPGEQVNLIVVQKQIIADTMALSQASASTNFSELSFREKLAGEFGRTYLTNMAAAPAEAVAEMQAAIAAMEKATASLEKRARDSALPAEEEALARLYQVLALLPDLKSIPIPPIPQLPQPPQKPQLAVSLQEIKKPAKEEEKPDPEIEQALEEARELREEQEALNELGEKLALAQRGGAAQANEQNQQAKNDQQAKGKGDAQGKGEGEGEGEGEGQGQGQRQGQGQDKNQQENPNQPKALANGNKPNENANQSPQLSQANQDPAKRDEEKQNAEKALANEKQLAQLETPKAAPYKPPQVMPLQKAPPKNAKAGSGKGKGKGKAKGSGQKGKGKGQGTLPGDGSGQPSNQPKQQPQAMAANEKQEGEPEPQTPEELAQLEEELSQEAKALVEMLERLAGKGRRVGHNVAVSANKAAEHMEGAAEALKQGNAAGAGMRGTMSTAELDKVVSELERLVAKRPDLTDVSAEEAPKQYEAFISEYFRKLSYEK